MDPISFNPNVLMPGKVAAAGNLTVTASSVNSSVRLRQPCISKKRSAAVAAH